MTEGYCVKCKATRTILNAVEDSLKDGRRCVRGKCPTCGLTMYRILGGPLDKPVENPVTQRPQFASN